MFPKSMRGAVELFERCHEDVPGVLKKIVGGGAELHVDGLEEMSHERFDFGFAKALLGGAARAGRRLAESVSNMNCDLGW